jgi:DNA-binding transcriptional ArsR family regulator
MPTAETAAQELAVPPASPFSVSTSLAMELVWATLIKPDEDEATYAARATRFASAPDLTQRILDFWEDRDACFTEVLLVAERGGVLLEDDPDRLWAGLAEAAALPPRYEPLTSESEEDKVRFRSRMARLHTDPERRAAWLQLLRDVWTAVAEQYKTAGRDEIEAEVWRYRSKLPRAGTYADLAPLVGTCDFHGMLPRVIGEAVAAYQEIVVVPSWLGRKAFVVTFADRVMWAPAAPTRPAGPSEETRRRSRFFKALGDPTRLAIFETIAHRPRAVGELATELGVTQPTISNHVRILRDAGLLAQDKGEGRRLSADTAAFERGLREARRAVIPSSSIVPLGN